MYYIDDEELLALKKVFEKKKLFRYSANELTECDLFEKEFSSYLHQPHAILVSSGTNALIAALKASGIGAGDEVLVPSYTFVATATAVIQIGAKPVFVNVDSQLSLSVEEAESKITPKTKAVIAVHMDGLSANIRELSSFSQRHNLILIEDVAQALGGSHQGQALGTFGAFGCFSLNENKIISCGEGGIVTTRERSLYEKAFCIHDTSSQFSPSKKGFYQEVEPFFGHSMRVSEIQGAIMRVQLRRLPTILEKLRARKTIFLEVFKDTPSVRIVNGYCSHGDIATSFHLQFETPEQALGRLKKLNLLQIPFYALTMRPAHASWKWSHLQEPDPRNATALFLDSVSILSRTLKLDLNIDLSPEDTYQLATHVRSIVK